MSDSIRLRPDHRKTLLCHYRGTHVPAVRLRCHILLLLDAGHPWALITAVLFTSSATINRWRRAYLRDGIDAVLAGTSGRQSGRWWVGMIVRWVVTFAPTDFRFARSRWSCEAVAVVLREDHAVRVSRETIRRRLREADLVWRRPRPVVRRLDPERGAKLAALRKLLHGLPADEAAVFMDEVEVHTNPKIGCMWMGRGQQATVETPGDNEKRVLAGSLHWRSGRLVETWGNEKEGRTAGLFCRHLDDLRRAFRQYRVRALVRGSGIEDGLEGIDVNPDHFGTEFGEQPELPDAAVAEVGHTLVPQAAEAGRTEPLQGQQVGQRRAVMETLVGALVDGHWRPSGAVGGRSSSGAGRRSSHGGRSRRIAGLSENLGPTRRGRTRTGKWRLRRGRHPGGGRGGLPARPEGGPSDPSGDRGGRKGPRRPPSPRPGTARGRHRPPRRPAASLAGGRMPRGPVQCEAESGRSGALDIPGRPRATIGLVARVTDLHLIFLHSADADAFFHGLAGTEADAFLLSGDIGEADDVARHLNALDTAVQRPIYFVLGNHDFYRGSIAGVRETVRQLCDACPGLHYLPDAGVVGLTVETGLVGHDGWGDGRLGDYAGSDVMLNDWGLNAQFDAMIR